MARAQKCSPFGRFERAACRCARSRSEWRHLVCLCQGVARGRTPRHSCFAFPTHYGLPLSLSKVVSGDYARAMASFDATESYADYQAHLNDRYASMDFQSPPVPNGGHLTS